MSVFNPLNRSKLKHEVAKYQYDHLPHPFLIKIEYIWNDALGIEHAYSYFDSNNAPNHWKSIRDDYCRIKGLERLGDRFTEKENFKQYIENENSNIKDVLNFIEFTFQYMERVWKDWHPPLQDDRVFRTCEFPNPTDLVEKLNNSFKEHSLGYQYLNGEIIRIADDYSHTEMTQPAMKLLIDHKFKGAAEEFTNAHKHFKEGRLKESITDCNKAFESTMKSICNLRKWTCKDNATAKTLIEVLITNKLLSKEQESVFNALKSLLESGVPTIRNKHGAHGQGIDVQTVNPSVAQYALNMTASNIIFLIQCNETMR
jgi:hypothetical protein